MELPFPTLKELGWTVGDDLFLTALAYLSAFFILGYLLQWFLKKKQITIPTWVGYVLVALPIALRLLGIGSVSNGTFGGVSIDMIVGAFVMVGLAFIFQPQPKIKKAKRKFGWWDVGAIAFIILLGAINGDNLDIAILQPDDFHQFEAAISYNQTGDFARYDFVREQPMETPEEELVAYPRAKAYTWIVAQSMNVFGATPFAARLPALVFYIMFAVGVYVVVRLWRQDPLAALLTALLFIFFQKFLLQARNIRMYTLFLVLTGGVIVSWYHAIRSSLREKLNYWLTGAWILLAMGLTAFALHFQPIIALFYPALGFFVIVEWAVQAKMHGLKSVQSKRLALWIGLGAAAILLGLAVNELYPFFREDLFKRIEERAREYETYGFTDYPLFGLAICVYLIGVILSFKKGMADRYVALLPIPLIYIFVFYLNHFTSPRYFLIASLLIAITIGLTLYDLLIQLPPRKKPAIQYPIVAIIFLLLIMPLSFPGIKANVLMERNPANRISTHHDAEPIFAYIKEHKQPGDVVFGDPLRTYYWGADPDMETWCLRYQIPEALTKKNVMQAVMEEAGHGWILWNNNGHNQYPARKKVRTMISETSKRIQDESFKKSDYILFYFDVTEPDVSE